MPKEGEAKRKRGEGSLFTVPHSPYIHCQYYSHGRAIRVSTKETDERKAQKFLRQRMAEVRCGIHKDTRKLRYEEMRAAYYADYAANRRKSLRHDKDGQPTLDKVKRLDGFFSGWLANDIDADAVRKFQAAELARGRAGGTINRSVSSLCRMFTLAKEDGKLRDTPYFPMLKEAAPRSDFIENTQQLDALVRVLPSYLKVPVCLGFYTGMREGEILHLRWSQVDFTQGEITLRDGETKNDKGRVVPIVGPLQAVLVEQFRRRPAGMEFVCWRLNHRGKPERIQSFRKAWNHACCKIGLGEMVPVVKDGKPVYEKPRGLRSKPKPKTKYRGVVFHATRRSCVRFLVRSGVPEVVCQRVTGHKSRAVFDRYNIVSPRDLSEASRKLEQFFEAQAEQLPNPTSDTEQAQPAPKTPSIN